MSTITGAPYAGATLTVDLSAIRVNCRLLRSRLGATACAAIVKADAYGLGAAVAPALAAEGCRRFFVARTSARTATLRREATVPDSIGGTTRRSWVGAASMDHRRFGRLR